MPSRPKRRFALFFLLLFIIVPQAVSSEPLTLDAAVQRAIERHPAVIAAHDSARAAWEGVEQADSAWYPRVNLNSTYFYNWPIADLQVDTGIVPPGQTESVVFTNQIGTANNFRVGLEAGWRALDFGARSALIEAAESSARAVEEDEVLRAVDIAYAVRVAYLSAVLLSEVEAITERSLESANRDLEDRRARLSAGLGYELEVASTSARVAELEARQVDVRVQREMAFTTLRLLLGMAPGTPIELVDDFEAVEASGGSSNGSEHPSIRQLDLLAEALTLQARSVDRSFWPTLDLFATFDYRFPWTMVDVEDWGFTFSGGVALTWQLFDGFQRANREDELRARVDATVHARDASDEELTRTRLDALSRRDAAAARFDAAQRQLEAAETYLRVALAAESAGAGSSLDVLDAQDAVDGALLAEAQARFESAVAVADLLRAEGVASGSSVSGQNHDIRE